MGLKIKDDAQLARARETLPRLKKPESRAALEAAIDAYTQGKSGISISLDPPMPGAVIEATPEITAALPVGTSIPGTHPNSGEALQIAEEQLGVAVPKESRRDPFAARKASSVTVNGIEDVPRSPSEAISTGDAVDEDGNIIEQKLPANLYRDEKLPNLSKDFRFQAPAAHTAGPALTKSFHIEPTAEYARKLLENSARLREQVGLDPAKPLPEVKEGSELYNKVADRLYQVKYNQAVAQGRQIVRTSQMDLGPIGRIGLSFYDNAVLPAEQAALWFDQGATGGATQSLVAEVADMALAGGVEPDLLGQYRAPGQAQGSGTPYGPPADFTLGLHDRFAEQKAAAPEGLATAASLAGALLPGSIPSRLTRVGIRGAEALGMGARNALADLPALGSRVLGAGGVGAFTGSGMSIISDVSGEVQNQGRSMPLTAEAQGIQGLFDRAVASGMVGGALGMASEPFAAIAQRGAGAIRNKMEDITRLEKGGGRQTVFGPILPRRVSQLLDDFRADWQSKDYRATAESRAVDRVAPALSRQGQAEGREVGRWAAAQNERYYQSKEGQELVSSKPMYDALWGRLMDLKQGGQLGNDDLFLETTTPLKMGIAKLSKPVWLRASAETPAGSRTMDLREAEELLGKRWGQRARAELQAALSKEPPGLSAEQMKLVLVPARNNARSMDIVIDKLHAMVEKAEKSFSGEASWLRELERAAYKTREQFRGNAATMTADGKPATWGELKRAQGSRIQRTNDTLRAAGLPLIRRDPITEAPDSTPLTFDEMQPVRAKIRQVWQGDDGAMADDAMMFLADRAGLREELKDVVALLASERLSALKGGVYGSAPVIGGGGPAQLRAAGGSFDVVASRAYGPLQALGSDPLKRLKLDDSVLAWLDAATSGAGSLAGGAPARVLEPVEALEILTGVSAMLDEQEAEKSSDAKQP